MSREGRLYAMRHTRYRSARQRLERIIMLAIGDTSHDYAPPFRSTIGRAGLMEWTAASESSVVRALGRMLKEAEPEITRERTGAHEWLITAFDTPAPQHDTPEKTRGVSPVDTPQFPDVAHIDTPAYPYGVSLPDTLEFPGVSNLGSGVSFSHPGVSNLGSGVSIGDTLTKETLRDVIDVRDNLSNSAHARKQPAFPDDETPDDPPDPHSPYPLAPASVTWRHIRDTMRRQVSAAELQWLTGVTAHWRGDTLVIQVGSSFQKTQLESRYRERLESAAGSVPVVVELARRKAV